jgi:hypothetical protein
MDYAELRKLYRQYCKEQDKLYEKCGDDSALYLRLFRPMPEVLRGLTCGARTRAGTPCKRKDIYNNGRCKFHGGLSTGPRTAEGKKRSSMNGFKSKEKRTP